MDDIGAGAKMDAEKVGLAIVKLTETVGRIEGMLNGLVTHEVQADKHANLRREWRADIQASEKDAKTSAKERVQAAHDREALILATAEQTAKAEAQRAVTAALEANDKNMKRAQAGMWTGGGVGVVGGLGALLTIFNPFGGG